MPSPSKQTSRKQPLVSPGRQFAQITLPFVLPGAWVASLMKLLMLDYPLEAYALSLPIFAATLALGFCLRIAAKKAGCRLNTPGAPVGLRGLSAWPSGPPCLVGCWSTNGPRRSHPREEWTRRIPTRKRD